MDILITINPDGTVNLITQEGTFEQGVEKLEALRAVLKAYGIDLEPTSGYETHRHDQEHAHVHVHVRK